MKSRLLALVSAWALLAVACGRTDGGITTAVKGKLVADDTVRAGQVNVDTKDHVVTLTGEVRTQLEKEKAVQLARNTDGVRHVVDQITVVPPPQVAPPDTGGNPPIGNGATVPVAPAGTPPR